MLRKNKESKEPKPPKPVDPEDALANQLATQIIYYFDTDQWEMDDTLTSLYNTYYQYALDDGTKLELRCERDMFGDSCTFTLSYIDTEYHHFNDFKTKHREKITVARQTYHDRKEKRRATLAAQVMLDKMSAPVPTTKAIQEAAKEVQTWVS